MLARMTPPTYLKVLSGRGPSPSEVQSLLRCLPHIVLYVTSRGITESSPEAADVLYAYPSDITDHPLSPAFRIFKSRGVFVTLCQLLGQVTGDGKKPQVTSVLLDGINNTSADGTINESQLVHIGYTDENGDLLLLALPGKLTSFIICLIS